MLQRGQRGRGIQDNPGFRALALDHLERPVQVRADLLVNGDAVRASLDKQWSKAVGVRDHQMHVQSQPRELPQRGHNRGTDTQVWHEMPVHHVAMQRRDASGFHRAHLFAKARKIRR